MTCRAWSLEAIIWRITPHNMLYESIHPRNDSIVSIKSERDLRTKVWLIYSLKKGTISPTKASYILFAHSHGGNQLAIVQMTGYWSLMKRALDNEGVRVSVSKLLQSDWWESVGCNPHEEGRRVLMFARFRLGLGVCIHMIGHLRKSSTPWVYLDRKNTIPKMSTT